MNQEQYDLLKQYMSDKNGKHEWVEELANALRDHAVKRTKLTMIVNKYPEEEEIIIKALLGAANQLQEAYDLLTKVDTIL